MSQYKSQRKIEDAMHCVCTLYTVFILFLSHWGRIPIKFEIPRSIHTLLHTQTSVVYYVILDSNIPILLLSSDPFFNLL